MDGCGRPKTASLTSSGERTPQSDSGDEQSRRSTRGRKRGAPEEASAFEDEFSDDSSGADDSPDFSDPLAGQPTWAAKLTMVERALESHGLKQAALIAVESMGGEIQTVAAEIINEEWVHRARIMQKDTHMPVQLFATVGKGPCERTARRSTCCQVLSYANCVIAVNIERALRPMANQPGLAGHEIHPHLRARLQAMSDFAKGGRSASEALSTVISDSGSDVRAAVHSGIPLE